MARTKTVTGRIRSAGILSSVPSIGLFVDFPGDCLGGGSRTALCPAYSNTPLLPFKPSSDDSPPKGTGTNSISFLPFGPSQCCKLNKQQLLPAPPPDHLPTITTSTGPFVLDWFVPRTMYLDRPST